MLTDHFQNLSCATEHLGQVSQPTGKGRSSMSAGLMDVELPRSTRCLSEMRTEGKLPAEGDVVKSVGPVNRPSGEHDGHKGDSDGLQRAFQRQQHSKLMDELAFLQGKLEKGPNRKTNAAKVYYDNWKVRTPLQRIQIEPRLPDALREHKFQRTRRTEQKRHPNVAESNS